MSDFRFDPEMRRAAMSDYDAKSMWAGLAVLALLIGGMIVAASYTDNEQTAMKAPMETTGSASPIPVAPPQ